jgi:hypothetical protein
MLISNTCIGTVAYTQMELTPAERERITDSVLKIQSVRASLEHIDEEKVPTRDEMEVCLEGVDHGLREALGYARDDRSGSVAPGSSVERTKARRKDARRDSGSKVE